jgi:hypothetical protein
LASLGLLSLACGGSSTDSSPDEIDECSSSSDCSQGERCAAAIDGHRSCIIAENGGYAGSTGSPGDVVAGNAGAGGFPGGSGGIGGYTGYGGISGSAGYSGIAGFSGYSGISGSAGYPGYGGYTGSGGTAGRPFLVQQAARLAPVAPRRDWQQSTTPRVDHLTPTERIALAEHWTRMGQMEHASIAAFARFSLQLLSLGAPPELVEACTQALADETAHTKLCFGIASAYAGRAIGPGPLDVSNSLNVTSLSDIVDLVIAEGCFGETSAALEALEAADTASDPVIAAAYSQIAADEQRHAELAFRFVAWALEREPAAVRERIDAALHSRLGQGHAARSVTVPCLSTLAGLARAA